jgi:hypothetical protein
MLETIYLISRGLGTNLGDTKGLVMAAESERSSTAAIEAFHGNLENAITADLDARGPQPESVNELPVDPDLERGDPSGR